MSIIEQFVIKYKKHVNDYQQLAQICAQQCESILERNGIRAIVTYRAKRSDRLQEKLIKRAERKQYQSMDDIFADIVDLAGVRIALYFPGDRDEVDAFIRSQFAVEECKDFPQHQQKSAYHKRFAGYSARHYRIRLKQGTLADPELKFANQIIEIQLGSVLMHAWAEVEHDLVYKPQTGDLSYDEYAILDELNGLVHAGEIALERLQLAVKRRITSEQATFKNHYEVSSFLHARVKELLDHDTEPIIGRADIFYKFLQLALLDSPAKLESYLSQLNPNHENRPVVEQIVDRILSDNEHLYEVYNQARLMVSKSDPYGKPDETISYFAEERALGFFMRRWIALETVAHKMFGEAMSCGDYQKVASFRETQSRILDHETSAQLDQIRQLRNQVIHGGDFPSEQELIEAGRFLEQLLYRASQQRSEIKAIASDALGRGFGR